MLTDANNNLKKDWGAAYEQNKNIADQAATVLGMGEKEVMALGAALGPDKAMQLLHKLGTATGEAKFVTGMPGAGGEMTPDQAKAKVKELINDQSFRTRLMNKESDALRQWDKVNKQAYPGLIST